MEDSMETYRPLFINGEWVEPAAGETQMDTNPATGEETAKIAMGTEEDVNRAVVAAQKAFDDVWADTPPKERSAMLLKLADLIDENADELARLESVDVGKPISVSAADIPFISDNLRFFAGAARCPGGKSTDEYERGFTSMVRREPLGVTVGICPWNYPLMMMAWKIGPALAAGNTSIIKPAQLTPLTALKMAELAADVLPPGVLNVVTGRGSEIGAALTRHPVVASFPSRAMWRPARPSPPPAPKPSSAAISSSAAKPQWSYSTTPIWTRPSRRCASLATPTQARTAPRPAAS
jgi:acyl-CoA reductase-like NAD-dependent aldehyde dehydrogenase